MKTVRLAIALLLLALLFPLSLSAQTDPVCESEVIVQTDDWLSKIAGKAYGDVLAYPQIVETTNAKAAVDPTFALIKNPDLIEPGWKLCLPPASTEAVMMPSAQTGADGEDLARLTFLQMNDVYEMTPVSGGAEGGMARVATLDNQLRAENPNTYMVLAGDLFSPSALGTAKVEGERLAGKQMVAVMNAIGLDFATFGNHEFDIKEDQFYDRLAESETVWVSSNVFNAAGQPFSNVPANHTFTIQTDSGKEVTVGLFGLTLGSNGADYVSYTDPLEAAARQVAQLAEQVDILVAVTHLPLDEDVALAKAFPEIDLILGGHEHENHYVEPGPGLAPVAKADANARTVYIHRLSYNPQSDELQIESELKAITPDLADNPAAQAVINTWLEAGFAGFRESGFEPERVVTEVTEALNGLESSVRNGPTTLTNLIAAGMLDVAPEAELAIFNGGSIRIDDIIPPGEISEYDVIRILPFGGTVLLAEFEGPLLAEVLSQGRANAGTGGYLQTANVAWDSANNTWLINDVPLDLDQKYKVAINDFLLTGLEQNLDYLNTDNPGVTVLEKTVDIRMALIAALKGE